MLVLKMLFLRRQNCGIIFVVLIFCIDICYTKSNDVTTSEHEEAASEILHMMNQSVDPCENFYEFACGKLMTKKKTTLNYEINRVRDRHKDVEEDILYILQSKTYPEHDKFSTARKIFETCKKLFFTQSEKQKIITNIAKYVGLLQDIPNSENMIARGASSSRLALKTDQFDWIKVIHKFRRIGLNFRFLFGLYVTPRSETDKRNILEIRRPILSEDHELGYMSDPLNVFPEYHLMKRNRENLKIINARDYFNYLEEHFPMQRYVEGLLPEDSNFSLDDEIRVDLNYISYAVSISKMLAAKPTKLARVLYLKLKAEISKLMPTVSGNMKTKFCKANTIQYDFNFQVAIAKRYFSEQHKNLSEELVTNILRNAKRLVYNSKYLDLRSKAITLIKLEKLQLMVGHSENTIPTPSLDWSDINSKTYINNLLMISKYQTDAKFRQLNLVKDVREWDFRMPPLSRNAVYYRTAHSVYFPATYMYAKMFDGIDLPKYLYYGTIGVTMGHEIGHVIHRSLLESSQMKMKLKGKELEKERNTAKLDKCLKDNFDVFKLGYEKTKRNEDIADLFAYKTAYKSYLEYIQNNGEEEQLPGLNYNSKQMFWIATASSYCSNHGSDHNDLWHGPKMVRVLMPLSNLPEFSRDFNCPLGSKMNRVTKCELL